LSAKDTPGPIGLDAFQKRVGEWADATFTQATPTSIVAHLRREVEELAATTHLGPPDAEEAEAADCFLLLLHLAHRRGYSLLGAAHGKFAENRARRWGQPDAEGVVEHVREEGEATP
jgi:NTP pyrophosphatase (non-canonical NTP hydrolase)